MSQDNRVSLPSGGAGLTRYFEEHTSKFSIRPEHVILIALFIMAIVIILHQYGRSWVGLP